MDLQGRSQFESDFAAKVKELSARQRRELIQLMGNPPDPERITQADWDRWEREDREKWLLLLLLVFNASYAQHYRLAKGEPLDNEASAVMSAAGQLWATAQAERLSRGFAATSEEMFNASRGRWRAAAQRGSSVSNYSGNRGYAFTEEDLSDCLDGIFSGSRAENVGVTETTNAASSGAEAAIVRTTGFSEQDTWFTEKDSKVCPICVPLHKQPRSVWAGYFPGGPPAHPRCRCWIQYAAERVGQLAGV